MQMHHRMLLLFLLICSLLAPRTMIQAQTPQIEITPIPEDPTQTPTAAPQHLYLPLINNSQNSATPVAEEGDTILEGNIITPTTTIPTDQTQLDNNIIAAAPGNFGKLSPANSAIQVSPSVTLSWQRAANAVQYGYCIDTTLDITCDRGVDNFIRINGTSVNVTLEVGKAYQWQVRAYSADGKWTPANGSGQWWSFTTNSFPAPFSKTFPANNATGVSTVTTLTWNPSVGASYYLVCIDTTSDLLCKGSGDNTNFVRVDGTRYGVWLLYSSKRYSWQVRAVAANGNWTAANGSGQWWDFITR